MSGKKQEKVKKKNSEKAAVKHLHRPRFLTILTVIAVTASVLINGGCAYDILRRKPENQTTAVQQWEDDSKKEEDKALDEESSEKEQNENSRRDSGYISYYPTEKQNSLDNVITSEDDAMKVLENIQDQLGIYNVSEEFYCESTRKVVDDTFYSMQQKYNDIEVDGGVITLHTDKSGKLLNVNGYYRQLQDFNSEYNLSESDAADYLKKYMKSNYSMSEDDFSYDKVALKIFNYGSENVVAYRFSVGTQVIIIDANSGNVLSDDSFADFDMVTTDGKNVPYLQGQKSKQKLDVNNDYDNTYTLKDTERKINIFMPADANAKNISNKNRQVNEVSYEIEYKQDKNGNDIKSKYKLNPVPDKSAVDALANCEKIYDYFLKYKRFGIKNDENFELPVYLKINSRNQNSNTVSFLDNAAMVGNEYMYVTERSSSSDPEYSYALDVMAHEWTHGVVYSSSSSPLSDVHSRKDGNGNVIYDRQKSTQLAINEGLADIFGEFVENYAKKSCDWSTEQIRNAKTVSGNQLTDARKFVDGTTDCHYGATIISHAVYNMCNNSDTQKKIDIDDVSEMIYYTFSNYTNTTDFPEFRRLVESQALSMNLQKKLTDKQLECVIDEFDNAGIDNSYSYDMNVGGELNVYDINKNPYDNYHVKIYKGLESNDSALVADEDVKNSAYKLPDEIIPGIYTVVFSDPKSGSDAVTKTITMIVNDNSISNDPITTYKDSDKVFTKFGSKTNQVVLCIDCSGSMNGEPMAETKKSAVSFVNKILDSNPATTISVVTYSSNASVNITASSNKTQLVNTINNIQPSDSTNMYDGLSSSDNLFDYSAQNKKMLVIMSDGLPNVGEGESSIKSLSADMRTKDVTIFSLGFFHNSSGEDLTNGIKLMRSLTTNEFYYNVRNSDDLSNVFELLSYQVSGDNYNQITVACPVNVEVKYKGETLSSDSKNYNSRTSFGYLFFENITDLDENSDENEGEEEENTQQDSENQTEDNNGEKQNNTDNMKKILRLKDGIDYEVKIVGTGKGKMSYSVSYPDENGEYTDVRSFDNIGITKKTLISARNDKDKETVMNVDDNGDGIIDKQYKAGKNEKGKLQKKSSIATVIKIAVVVIAAILVAVQIILMILRNKKNSVCSNCKMPLKKNAKFCGRCGTVHEKSISVFPD